MKARRLQLRLTQAELAARAGVSKRTVQLSERGQNISVFTMGQIAEAVGLAVEEVTQAASFDALQEGPWSLHQFVTKRVLPEPSAFCQDACDVQIAIEHMQKNWEIQLKQNKDLANSVYADAFRKQREAGGGTFYNKYIQLWKANNNAFMYATSNCKRNGVSAILPVTNQAFEDLKSGEMGFLEIDKSHICEYSQNLVIDSCVEFHGTEQESIAATSSLRFASFFQVALLSKDLSCPKFRMLSFGASSKNEKRLKANGFTRCPGRTPQLGFSIYEFPADNSDLGSDDELKKSTGKHYAKMFWARVADRTALKTKRRLMLKISRLYQIMLNRNLLLNSRDQAA